jgi:hypothetical protein
MSEIRVTSQNAELLNRLDRNDDGVIEVPEAREAGARAGTQRIAHEAQTLTSHDRQQVRQLFTAQVEPIQLTFGDHGTHVGTAEGQTNWQQVRTDLTLQQASQAAPLGTVGQERPGSMDNLDCGPTSALYMHDRRIQQATDHAPSRTHAQADALISLMSRSDGTTGPQMAGIMNDHHRHAGSEYYEFASHQFEPSDLFNTLMTGLAADPGGVMVPIISTYNADQTSGTRHWIVVTGFDGENVQYYDPAGPDGARHEGTMSFQRLQGSLEAHPPFGDRTVVYGTHRPAAQVAGELAMGTRVGELEVALSNRDIQVSSTHGVYGSQDEADQAAQQVAQATGEDAVVRREGNGFAVYGVTEIRQLFGGIGSDNTLTAMDRRLTAVWMTDPQTQEVRRATSGP